MKIDYRYYANGELDDPHFTGLSVNKYAVDEKGEFVVVSRTPDGTAFLGYKAVEISKEEYDKYSEIIKDPDGVRYFAGAFPGIGVLDKATYKKFVAMLAETSAAALQKEVAANKVNYKLAKLDAEAIGESVEDVFKARCPGVSKEAFETLHKSAK